MTTINVILGSSRSNSLGRHILNYFRSQQEAYEELMQVKFNFIEIGDYQLPFFYEALPPLANPDRKLKDNEQKWIDDMAKADGFVFLTPEYNHSFPAVLKNGIDYLSNQLTDKPSLVMTYANNGRGGQFGGLELTPVLERLGSLVLPTPIAIGNVQQNFSEAGNLLDEGPSKDFYQKRLKQGLHKIAFYSTLLKNNPYSGLN
ncbi:NADPH-dependent FMN reductase [Holzapfeliella sp. JNUCC 80]